MALFPAYSSRDLRNNITEDRVGVSISDKSPSEYTESQLLASDSEESQDEPAAKVSRLLVNESPSQILGPQLKSDDDFYIDCKIDLGNLRVSTLYYPGRPQYECVVSRGGAAGAVRAGDTVGVRSRRYFTRRLPDLDVPDVDRRAAAYRALLIDRPHDVALWETYIAFQEECAGEAAASNAAEEASARVPHSARLRAHLLRCLRASLAPHELLQRLRDMLSTESSAAARVQLWEVLLATLSAARGSDATQVSAAAAAALAAAPRHDAPRLLHALGSYLRAAGLWERLVLLVELLVAMNYAPVSLPSSETSLADRTERRLLELEDRAMASGLPLGAVWVRVERARAAAHWRPAARAAASPDPQRTPLPHDVADLLLPVAADDQLLHLSVRLLLLAKVPMLPATDHWVRWAGGGGAGAGGEALLPLLLAARSLRPTHPARPSPPLARRLLALLVDPPHYFSDDTGYLSWVNALWEACCTRARGWARIALVCWRLRWLHALLLASGEAGEGGGEETRRLRGEGRALLKRFAAGSSLPYAEWARLEHSAAGVGKSAGGGAGRALHAALQALRAALADAACPPHHALHAARAVCEVSGSSGARLSAEGERALVDAALGRAGPPAPPAPPGPPVPPAAATPADDRRAALEQCERRCEAIERELEAAGRTRSDEDDRPDCADALLPGAGEWARARIALASPSRRVLLLERLCAAAPASASAAAARYWEEGAEALAATTRAAPRLAALFPHNAAIALAAAGAPLWAGVRPGPAPAAPPLARPAPLPALLPALLAALRTDFAPAEAEALVRVARRVTNRAGAGDDEHALAWSVRLEAEARAPRPRLPHALYAALDAAPHHKWLYVRGAAWCGGEAAVLADALLERSLRLHALPVELLASPAVRTVAAPELEEPNADETLKER